MIRAVGADLGLGTGRPPVWRRDNPFWAKAVRGDARRYLLAGRLLLTTLTLAVLLTGGLALPTVYPGVVRDILHTFGSPLSWPGWLFVLLSFVHALLILGTRQAFSTQISLEAQRQTLPMLLLTPLRRAEMLWAMAVPPAAAAGIIALAGLPFYLLLREFGGCEGRDIGLLFVVFALLVFEPPAYLRPGLSPDPPPVVTNARAARGRRGGGNVLSSLPLFVFLTWTLGGWVRGMGGWGFHLLSVLPSPARDLLLILFAWPFCAALLLAAPLPFFGGHLPPGWYVVPLVLAGWVGSALRTGAALAAGDERDHIPSRRQVARRAVTWQRGTTWLGRFCLLAFVWQPWVLGGDTGRLLGAVAPDPAENLAGLLLVLGGVALLRAGRVALFAVGVRRDTGRRRPPRRMLRRVLRRAGRPLRQALGLFALGCLCGGASPFASPVYAVLGRLALVALAAVVCAVGYAAWTDRWITRSADQTPGARRRQIRALLALTLALVVPAAALSLPFLSPLAALSPAMAWLELFPGSDATLHAFPFWTLGPLPPFALCIGAPFALGMISLALAYLPARAALEPRPSRQTRPAAVVSAVAARHPHRTAALMAWISAWTDNPLFTYEMRTQTRSGRWYSSVYAAGILLLIALVAATQYPDLVAVFSFFSLLGFFRPANPFVSAVPSVLQAFADVAALALSVELYVLALRGQMVGEALFWKDMERGTLGSLLLTPLTAAQIFWGKLWGQSAGYVAGWVACGAGGLLLYLLASPAVGLGPALSAWAVSQIFVAAAFLLGLGFGAAAATHTLRRKSLRGLSTLLLVLAYALGFRLIVWPDLFHLFGGEGDLMTRHLLLGSLYAVPLAALGFAYARHRVAALRRGDMVFGEGGAG